MSKVVNVKGYGKAVFPDHFTPDQMRTALRKRFNPVGAVEAAGTIGSSIVAEPVSGLAGIAGAVLPGKEGQGADWVKATQDALTYQPRTESGQNTIKAIGEKLAPIGEIIEGASKKLRDKAYAETESPALAAAAYSAPTAFLEGLGLKGLSIAKAPAGSMNLSVARSGLGDVGSITSVADLFDHSPSDLAAQLKKSDPSKVTSEGAWRVESNRFYTDYMPDGSTRMTTKDGRVIKELSPVESARLFRERILEVEASKPAVQDVIQKRQEAMDAEARKPEGYRMQHKAPTRSKGNPTADNLSEVFEGIYSADTAKMITDGLPYDKKAIQIIRSMQGNPNKEVLIYRAVPKSVKDFSPGDWVTTTKEYALDHMGDMNDWHIITKKVKASEIASDGNSIHEFGFEPKK